MEKEESRLKNTGMGCSLCSLMDQPLNQRRQRPRSRGLSSVMSEPFSTYEQIMAQSTGRSFQVLKTANSCLFQMGLNCLLWGEYSFHLHLPQGPHNQPKRNTEMLYIWSLLDKKGWYWEIFHNPYTIKLPDVKWFGYF